MNSNKLLNTYTDKLFCDLKLTIIDDDQQSITIDTHKIILYTNCPYFEKLLLFNDKNCTEKTINVPNTQICCNIIESFYSEKNELNLNVDPIYQFQLYMCRDFFGLKQDKNMLFSLKISNNLFDELLRFAELNNHDFNIIEQVFCNIPENYDFEKIPKNLLLVMKKYITNSKMYILNDNGEITQYDLCFENLLSEKIKCKTFENKLNLYENIFSINDNEIAIMKNNIIEIYDNNDNTLINKISLNQILIDDVINLEYCNNNLLVVNRHRLILIDNINGKLLKSHKLENEIDYVMCTDNFICVQLNAKNKVVILNSETLKPIKCVKCYNNDCVDNKMIYEEYKRSSKSTYIHAIDILSDKVISKNKISGIIGTIHSLDVDFRFEKYVVIDVTNIIKIFDVISGKLISEYDLNKFLDKYKHQSEHIINIHYAKFLHDSRYIIIDVDNGRYFIFDTVNQKTIEISSKFQIERERYFMINHYCQYLSEIDAALQNLSKPM
ncbi:putative BTB/POZ domain-containing protein [Cotonvirus japonicus]|uniref:BTB/POZ domain-containing protein n=1 Tax=Cotonvirus japonicus TaxID=2811091 RepID=A0ABM7NUF7_9VIRU|nr:putative BTB/POZ domain-containing protein [Cotonvirus japonicus]BCS83707.1 putative BTB/POZ domain-containing protein [Cotonvirus japonicus]